MEGIGAPYPLEVTPEINDLGRFAVEHNKKELIFRTLLEFKKVYSAQKQLVNGTNYYLTLEAANEGRITFMRPRCVECKGGGGGRVHVLCELEAADGGDNYIYEATVLEKAGEKVKELLEFKLVGAA
ncbi:hypothetical protein Sango_0415000 [Sesamum angolense]|uniref:Cysteine proteinase inhibitor n=1 Tax=Sesamum angolense TaxID=2727404 RepID=A0AAE1XAP2_9LAMI|nr:hypothetical protein Sango_0415000 [Sesamum angolense]